MDAGLAEVQASAMVLAIGVVATVVKVL